MSTPQALHALATGLGSGPEIEPARDAGCSVDADEPALVRAAALDPREFGALYRRHYPAIHRYLRRRLGDPHAVEDAVSETFASALEQLPRYEQRGLPFRAWLYRIATGSAHRHRRRAARWASAQLDHEEHEDLAAADDRELDRARSALLRVAPRLQDVLVLHHVEGLGVVAIARALGIAEGTVKSRLARGRAALRRQLERLEDRA